MRLSQPDMHQVSKDPAARLLTRYGLDFSAVDLLIVTHIIFVAQPTHHVKHHAVVSECGHEWYRVEEQEHS